MAVCVDHEDVPPLDDLAEDLKRIGVVVKPSKASQRSDPQTKGVSSTHSKLSGLPSTAQENVSKTPSVTKQSAKKAGAGAFGGFSKGFLTKPTPKPSIPPVKETKPPPQTSSPVRVDTGTAKKTEVVTKSKVEKEELPYLKANPDAGEDFLGDMREEMERTHQRITENREWITDDLLQNIQSDPVLRDCLADERFRQVIQRFPSDPEVIQAEYKDVPQMRRFLQKFCALLGDHFTTYADQQGEKREGDDQREEKREGAKKTCKVEEIAENSGQSVKVAIVENSGQSAAVVTGKENERRGENAQREGHDSGRAGSEDQSCTCSAGHHGHHGTSVRGGDQAPSAAHLQEVKSEKKEGIGQSRTAKTSRLNARTDTTLSREKEASVQRRTDTAFVRGRNDITDGGGAAAASIKEQASPEDIEKMTEILARPQVKKALADPTIQRLLAVLQNHPGSWRKLLQSVDSEVKRKVQVLVENGILALAP